MGCSSQRDVQTNEIKKLGEEEHLQISINPELIEEFQPKIEEQEEMDKPEENLEEIYDKIQPEIEIKKGDEKFEEENPEDLEIESDEYQTILLGGAPPETMERFNQKENDGINKRKNSIFSLIEKLELSLELVGLFFKFFFNSEIFLLES